MWGFTWKCNDQKTGAQLATVVGGGLRARRGPKSSLPGSAGWIKSGSCPVADLFKACADVLSSPQHNLQAPPQSLFKTKTKIHKKSPSLLRHSLDPCNQNIALRWFSNHQGTRLPFDCVSETVSHTLLRSLSLFLKCPFVCPAGCAAKSRSVLSHGAVISEWTPFSPPLFTSRMSFSRQANRGQEAMAVIRSNACFPVEIENKHCGPGLLAGEAPRFQGDL